ncbi:MAG TPA: dehydratase [Alphaproteobacteria bacterium]|nr:dehydratase [Alphaproteobacteria bacterium]HAJ47268.1 dehydratase [Alphaproteobacteria bacterium]
MNVRSLWLEDIELGVRTELGQWTFTREDIITFARAYDPQTFHVDEEAAAASPYGGLIASGWHTAAIWMKLMVRYRQAQFAAAGLDERQQRGGGVSPGFLDLRWLQPVRPGDTVSYATETKDKVLLKSRTDLGLIRSLNTGHNQHGDLVISFVGQGLFPRKPDGAG